MGRRTTALLCAKAFKLHDRLADSARQDRSTVRAKDASDVWRLVVVSRPAEVAATWLRLERDPKVGPTASAGRERLVRLLGTGGAAAALADQALRAEPAYEPLSIVTV